ncbi:metallophosphoesterase [uncultured Thiohalocapsa sp.]|uniref:metallophosphoesterase n=1 Tax=uncultured Thiohalocapsa sp. TaxID=768990 RepID=UPI0025D97158|nr:metallophosphoesterase [uncultured Thiohalocapsa sp.]
MTDRAEAARQMPDAASGMDAADYAELARRLGRARLRRRLNTQIDHVAGDAHQDAILLGLSRVLDIDVLADRTARLLRIHGWGYRNFLDLRLVEHRLAHPRLPPALAGLRVLQLSDLHLDLDPALGTVLRERLAGVDYDIAVITGDFRNTTDADHGPSVAETLALLGVLRPPVYAVLGNHDFIEIVPPLERAGLRFLLNEVVPVPYGGARLYLAGVDDPHFYRTHDLAGVRDAIPDEGFTLLLCHSPETYREAADYGFDVMLSGHTHGGQICLPGGHALVQVCNAPKPMQAGPWHYRQLVGYTSVGTGACGVPLRWFCPPEITLHRLERGS